MLKMKFESQLLGYIKESFKKNNSAISKCPDFSDNLTGGLFENIKCPHSDRNWTVH